MSNPVVPIVFMGLVAFFPQKDLLQRDSMTAILVNDDAFATADCNHDPMLMIEAGATILSGNLCKNLQGTVTCGLGHGMTGPIELFLDTQRSKVAWPAPPPDRMLPHQNTEADGGNPWWIVRMANVEPSCAVPDAGLSSLTDAIFEFGWSKMDTCAFDEGGNGTVYPMKFAVGAQMSSQEQAVAEQVLIVAEVMSTLPILRLERDGSETQIQLDCSTGICPALEFSNDVGNKCMEDQHFDEFFNFLKMPQFKYRPERDTTGGHVAEKDVEFKCSSAFAQFAQRKSQYSQGKDQGKRGLLPRIGPKMGDRIICPPVIFGQ